MVISDGDVYQGNRPGSYDCKWWEWGGGGGIPGIDRGNRICKNIAADNSDFHPWFISLKGFLGTVGEVLTPPRALLSAASHQGKSKHPRQPGLSEVQRRPGKEVNGNSPISASSFYYFTSPFSSSHFRKKKKNLFFRAAAYTVPREMLNKSVWGTCVNNCVKWYRNYTGFR